jgi:hypothetical protein
MKKNEKGEESYKYYVQQPFFFKIITVCLKNVVLLLIGEIASFCGQSQRVDVI